MSFRWPTKLEASNPGNSNSSILNSHAKQTTSFAVCEIFLLIVCTTITCKTPHLPCVPTDFVARTPPLSRVSASFVAKGSAFPCGPSGRSCVPTRGCQGSRYSRAPPFCCTSLPPRVCSVFQNAMLLLLRSAALPCSRLQALLPLARLEYSISKRVVHLASRCSAGAQLGLRAGPGAVQQLCDGGGRRGVRRPRVSGLTAFISLSLLSSVSPLSSPLPLNYFSCLLFFPVSPHLLTSSSKQQSLFSISPPSSGE